jgi:hypothetical protein
MMGICGGGGERKKKTAVTTASTTTATKSRPRNPVSAVAARLGIFRSKPKQKPTQNAATRSHTSSSTLSHKAKPQQKQKPQATPKPIPESKNSSNHNKSKVGKKAPHPKSRQKEKPSPNAWKKTFKITPRPEKSDDVNRPKEIVLDDFQKEDDPLQPESAKGIQEKRLLPNEEAVFSNSGTKMNKSDSSDDSEDDDVEIESDDEKSKKEIKEDVPAAALLDWYSMLQVENDSTIDYLLIGGYILLKHWNATLILPPYFGRILVVACC